MADGRSANFFAGDEFREFHDFISAEPGREREIDRRDRRSF